MDISISDRTRLRQHGIVLATILLLSIAALSASATQIPMPTVKIDWLQLGMSLFGGLALFLAGLEVLSEGLKKAAGNTLRMLLDKLTVNRFLGAITGAFVTGVLNSSSVTTVLVVGFVTAGVMTLSQSVGVIMGANIGSTVTAQILAFNISAYSLIPIAVGFFMFFAGKIERIKYLGMMVMGFGLVFYGMGLMSDGMNPLRTYDPFMAILSRMENPMFGILAGAIFTGLVQSSAATVGIAIAMASEGLLTLPAGIALALGANVGTCITALLAAMGKPTEATRAAAIHIIFNILGVVIWLPFISILGDLAVAVSPSMTGLEGKVKLAAEVPRQIANANTLFNVINTVLFIGFTPWFARLAERLIPKRTVPRGEIIQPEYLDEGALKAPSLALENARREIQRAGTLTLEMMAQYAIAIEHGDIKKLESVARRDEEVDILDAAILNYLSKVRQTMLTEEESHTHQALMASMINIESLADIMETGITDTVNVFIQSRSQQPSKETREMISELWNRVHRSVELAIIAVGQNNPNAAEEAMKMKQEIRNLSDQLFERHAERLRPDDPEYLQKVQFLMTIVEQLRHMYTLAKRIARTQLPVETALAKDE